MAVELKPTFIPADLHKWLKLLAVENGTTVQAEHERALREAQAARQDDQGNLLSQQSRHAIQPAQP